MLALKNVCEFAGNNSNDDFLFALIAQDIEKHGYSIMPTALSMALTESLFTHQQLMEVDKFKNVGIGRGKEYLQNSLCEQIRLVG